jgi:hypothetical protein
MAEVAKYTHSAATDNAENAFAATRIYPYMLNIVSDDDFEPSDITRKDKTPDENLEGTEGAHSDVDSASPRTPYNNSYYQKVLLTLAQKQ